ncbi:MAG TPA: HD domain-containing phosphohydrolase [Thermoleophilaceae bacterium]|nr:HD domain-containing phosphohydrolase [Thermoleophilaceae bacterium]
MDVVLAVAVLAALAVWLRERSVGRKSAAGLEGRLDAETRRADKLEEEIREERERVLDERRLRLRTQRARDAERGWTRELRDQVRSLYDRQGPSGDLYQLILQVAVELSGAKCGLLLAREDADGDGLLDLVCHTGFREDPSESALAQRFAKRVLEREEIIREDSPTGGHEDADGEIESLVAIPVYMHDGFEGVVVCANRPGGFEELDDDVLLSLGDHAGAALENQRLHGRLRSSYLAIVGMLADAVEASDPYVVPHSAEVSGYVDRVAKRLDIEPSRREQLQFASLLRDVGKLGVSERVLLKPGALSREERSVVELHPLIGARIVERVPGLVALAPAIRHHHERWDGHGYPDGLRGEEIPIEARIVAIADCYSGLISSRPYRQPLSPAEACAEIERSAGTQLDPEIAPLFASELRRHPPEPSGNGSLPVPPPSPARRGAVSSTSSDGVTLLYSHRHLLEVAGLEAGRAARHHRPFSVVMVELPELHEINRREGYAAGDLTLQIAARALERALAAEPATIGRFSGRRLGAILPGTGHHAAAEYGSAVQAALAKEGQRARIGVAVWQHGDHGEDVFARARLALEVSTPAA